MGGRCCLRDSSLSPLEGKRERLCGQLVGEVTTSSSMEVPVDGTEVAIEDRRERRRLM